MNLDSSIFFTCSLNVVNNFILHVSSKKSLALSIFIRLIYNDKKIDNFIHLFFKLNDQ